MSSHREAPEISFDPAADNADVYAFVSPDKPDTVTIVSNFVPLQAPAGGPNFFEFGNDVLYSIYVDNNGDAKPDLEYQSQFHSTLRNPNTFLYNTGPITSLKSKSWNKRQFFSVTRVAHGASKVLGSNLKCPPCNIGPRSTPKYETLAAEAIHTLPGGEVAFAGQRNDPFFVDLGGVFDLGDLRPFQHLHLISTPDGTGVDNTKAVNIHSIVIQVPIKSLTSDGSKPSDVMSSKAVLGIWSAASRRKLQMSEGAKTMGSGPWVQVSRLGNPLFNEVIVPLGKKDLWNSQQPSVDAAYLNNVQHPELGGLLPVLYPNVFPNLAGLKAARADLVAILLTGLPKGVVAGFQNYTGKTYADMLRLNVAVPPAKTPNPLGVVGGDLAGFPNGRRVFDDTTTIELRAIAGLTYPLIDKSFKPDAATSSIEQGVKPAAGRYLDTFPYVGTPYSGYDTPSS
jgi:hypothetical protein